MTNNNHAPQPPAAPEKAIEAAWRFFANATIPNHAPINQRMCMRTAFFCGVEIIFAKVMDIINKGDAATDEDIAWLESVAKELIDMRKPAQ